MTRLSALIALFIMSLAGIAPLSGQTATPDVPVSTVTTSSVTTSELPADVDSVVTTIVTRVYRGGRPVTVSKQQSGQLSVPADSSQSAGVQVIVPDTPAAKVTPAQADTLASPVVVYRDSVRGRPVNEHGKIVLASVDPRLLDERVVVGTDTVPIILPTPNYGRYDRGLFNFLFIPQGQWMFGLTASYGEFNSDDVQILSLIKDFSFKGKLYSIQPTVSYFFRSNQSMGLKFSYSRGIAALGGLSVDIDDDMSFTLSDISYYSQSYTASVFYRNYVGLGTEKRFAIFNEIDLAFGSGSSRFKRSYDGEMRDTKTLTSKWSLNFSPGVTMFIMDNACFNVSFGVFGLHVTHDKQYTNGEDEGTRTSSGANFRFNLFNINFGLGVTI